MRIRIGFLLHTSLATTFVLAGCGNASHENLSPPAPTVQAHVLTVKQANVSDDYDATGSVKALYNSTLSSKVMGRVIDVSVREGDEVKQGQVLVSLDPRELQANVQMAQASYKSSLVAVGNAKTSAQMEAQNSVARIASAKAQVEQAQASLAAAKARRDLVLAGPRPQEVDQAHLAVINADSNLKLAKADLDRVSKLVEVGALAKRELDVAQNKYDVAKGQYDIALQAENIAHEGSRSQDIQAAKQAVSEADAALKQANAGLQQAQADAMQARVRAGDVQSAKAQVAQNSASVNSAKVALSYASVAAPFSGRVVSRFVDPGAMAAPGTPLIGIEGGEYRLEATVPEDVIAHVHLGSAVIVQVDALANPLTGVIAEINPQASGDAHTFTIKVRLAPTSGVKSGMFGRAQIKVGDAKRVLIPTQATWEREGLHYVYAVNKDDIARLRIVTLGKTRGSYVEVLSGIDPGERIIAASASDVEDGAQVEALP